VDQDTITLLPHSSRCHPPPPWRFKRTPSSSLTSNDSIILILGGSEYHFSLHRWIRKSFSSALMVQDAIILLAGGSGNTILLTRGSVY
jgi:hypothetical protein